MSKKTPLIIACKKCGAVTSAPCEHNRWGMMTKAQAATLAIDHAFVVPITDKKTLSTGEHDND